MIRKLKIVMANNVDFAKLELNFLSYLNMLIEAIIFIIELVFNRHLNSVAHQNIPQNILILSLSDKSLSCALHGMYEHYLS